MWQGIIDTYKPHEITGKTIEEYIARLEEKVLPQPTQTYTVEMSDELYCFLWALGHFIFGIQGVTEFLNAWHVQVFESEKVQQLAELKRQELAASINVEKAIAGVSVTTCHWYTVIKF